MLFLQSWGYKTLRLHPSRDKIFSKTKEKTKTVKHYCITSCSLLRCHADHSARHWYAYVVKFSVRSHVKSSWRSGSVRAPRSGI